MNWKLATEDKPTSSTPMDIHRVLVGYRMKGLAGVPLSIQFGWWYGNSDRWYVEGSNNEPDVVYWMEVPELPRDSSTLYEMRMADGVVKKLRVVVNPPGLYCEHAGCCFKGNGCKYVTDRACGNGIINLNTHHFEDDLL